MVVAMLDRVVDAVFDRVLLAVVTGHLVMDLVRVVPAFTLLLLIEEKLRNHTSVVICYSIKSPRLHIFEPDCVVIEKQGL